MLRAQCPFDGTLFRVSKQLRILCCILLLFVPHTAWLFMDKLLLFHPGTFIWNFFFWTSAGFDTCLLGDWKCWRTIGPIIIWLPGHDYYISWKIPHILLLASRAMLEGQTCWNLSYNLSWTFGPFFPQRISLVGSKNTFYDTHEPCAGVFCAAPSNSFLSIFITNRQTTYW